LVSARRAGPVESGDASASIPKPTQIKLYNSGSFFDRRAIPPADYPAIAQRVRRFERVIVESHPALIGDSCLRFRDSLSSRLEVAMGLETAHPEVLARLNKRMTLKQFARAAEFTRRNGIALRVFILVKPPFLDESEALCWAKRSLDFAFDCGATVATLIPTRAGNGALEALAAQGQFSPPNLATLEKAAAYGVGLGRGRVFADLWDLEKFSTCVHCFTARLARLQEMNLRQAAAPLICCPQCGAAESRTDVSPAQDAGEAPFPA
jgi:radical SAM enzyme (TIGR01210 family)